MNKLLLLCVATALSASASAQTVKNMSELKPDDKAAAVRLTLTGDLTTEGNSDYRQLRDLCWQLRWLDLSQTSSRTIPANAFHSRARPAPFEPSRA